MKWSTQKINEIHKYLVDNSTLNIYSIMRESRINSILDDSEVGEFPYHTEGEFIKVPFIKKPFIQFDYTLEELKFIAELKSDATLLSQFIQIPNPQSGIVNFNLYPGQKDFVKNYPINRFNVVKHSRQVGMTNLMTLIVLHYITTKNDKTVVWICANYKHDFDRFLRFLSCVPFYISPGVVDIDKIKLKLSFENGCQIIFTKSETNSGDFVVIDNAAFMKLNKMISYLSKLTSVADGQFFIVSSPSKNSDFEKMFQAVGINNINWNKITMNWDVVPNRDRKWVSETINQTGGIQNFLDEYEVEGSTSKIRDLVIDLLNETK